MKIFLRKLFIATTLLTAIGQTVMAQNPQQEFLDRGAVAVKTDGGVFLSWRSLESDDKDLKFDIYRDGVKITDEPLLFQTNFIDPAGTESSVYRLQATLNDAVKETTDVAAVWPELFHRIHIDRPEGGISPAGGVTADDPNGKTALTEPYHYTYTPGSCSVGDVDGDGIYEIFLRWDPTNFADNAHRRYTGNVYIDCYRLTGEKLWRIDLGQNIRAGNHYTQFMVYDFDGDGKAEMAVKTAPGTIDGQGNPVLMGNDKVTDDYRNNVGLILSGSEYLTVFDGLTGANLATESYQPLRSVISSSKWGDSYGNRSERYLACVAYLDGIKPSIVMCRGYYTAAYIAAWDFDGHNLKLKWLHKSEEKGKGLYGEGAHSITVGDVDGDGCDEIVYGSACLDHDGQNIVYRTGFGHGDALHLGDLDPDRPGLEVFMVHEKTDTKYDTEFRDARTGEVIWGLLQTGNDIGRGLAADITDSHRGYEMWPQADYTDGTKANKIFDVAGNCVSTNRPSVNFRVYWDGDLLDEILDGTSITKMNSDLTSIKSVMDFSSYSNAKSVAQTKSTPCIQADLFGDWREELVYYDGSTMSDLLVFTTTIPTEYKVPCLMQDHIYRMAVAWQNVAYNQPPHLGYYLPDMFSGNPRISVSTSDLTRLVEIGYEMEPITGTWANAPSFVAEGLPEGVTLTVDESAQTFSISGSPVAEGTYEFTLSTSGAEPRASVSGSIIVIPGVEIECVAHYPFEQLGETTPNLIYGEAKKGGKNEALSVEGPVGNAVELSQVGVYYSQDAYDAIQLGKKDFTILLWFRSTGRDAYLFHKGHTDECWVGLEYKSGRLKFAVDDDVQKSEVSIDATEIFNDEWHHAALVRESSTGTLKIYIDGVLLGEAPDQTGSVSDKNLPLIIGNSCGLDNRFNGCLDEFRIYTGAMTDRLVREDFLKGDAPAGITEVKVNNGFTAITNLTLVDAITGRTVARGRGVAENVTSTAAPGIYILIAETNGRREISKIAVR